MTYSTHIPKTTYAQRHRRFLAIREEARRSVGNCQALHDVWVRACDAKLSRNYIDADEIERGTQQIVKLSHVMRSLRPLAAQPDPPRHEAVTPALTPHEARTYGGIKASRLVRVLRFFGRLRQGRGNLAVLRRGARMSAPLVNGLDIYKRVKVLIASLTAAIDTPDTAISPRARIPSQSAKSPERVITHTWEVSPQKIYGWTSRYQARGYDPRQTSVYWLEKQASALKRAVYHDHHGREVARVKTRSETPPSRTRKIKVRTFIPPKGAMQTGDIWPPIDLVRMVEERRANSNKHNTYHLDTPTCHPALDAGPRENLAHSTREDHNDVSGSRIKPIASNRQCGMTGTNLRKHEPWSPEP